MNTKTARRLASAVSITPPDIPRGWMKKMAQAARQSLMNRGERPARFGKQIARNQKT